jgi:hypothetical protein
MNAGCAGFAAAVCSLAGAAAAQQSVSINLAGVQLRNATNQTRSSAPNTISPAYRYSYQITGMVRGAGGLLTLVYPSPTPLATVLEGLAPGSSAFLSGTAENCSGTHPVGFAPGSQSGTAVISGTTVTYGLTISFGIDAAGVASFNLTDVTLTPTIIGYFVFDSGSATITRQYVCPANCDGSTSEPVLNVQDFGCFLNKFASGDAAANCDCSTAEPVLNVQDFACFLNQFAAGCPPI